MSYDSMKRVYITNRLGTDYVEGPNDELIFECPVCKELGKTYKDKKFYVNSKSGFYWCHRCQTKGKFSFGSNMKDFKTIDVVEDIYNFFSGDESEEEFVYKDIPKDRVIDNKDSGAYDYMRGRGFSDEMISKADLRVDRSLSAGQLFGRVVIPNEVVSRIFTDIYVARSFVGDNPKYLYPSDSNKSTVVYNLDSLPDNPKELFINEGALDSIVVGLDKSVSIYGKHGSDYQINKILSKNANNYYVSLDSDARKESDRLCEKLYERCNIDSTIYQVLLPEGMDAVDLGRDKYLELARDSHPYVPKRFKSLLEYFN